MRYKPLPYHEARVFPFLQPWLKGAIALLFVNLFTNVTHAKTTVTAHFMPEVENDYVLYHRKVLALALQKTVYSHGPFEIVDAPKYTIRKRALLTLKSNKIPNLVFPLMNRDEMVKDEQLTFANFPIFLGALGKRVCFTNAAKEATIGRANTLSELQKFTHIQGLQWTDVDILRHNGFSVFENSLTTSPAALVNMARADLFCRSIIEIEKESKLYRHLNNIRVETSFALEYPMFLYFYGHVNNTALIQRIDQGLKIAFNDGSMFALFQQFFGRSVQFSDMQSRRIFHLDNPFLDKAFRPDKKYLFKISKSP